MAAICVAVCAAAVAAVPVQRIGVIDDGQQVSVPVARASMVSAAADAGLAPASMAIENITLRFAMTDAQTVALDQLLADQQNPASPRYHQWLTPETFAAQFGLATADLVKVSTWLSTHGFTVNEVARGGTFIRFSGTVATVNAAFHTQMHLYTAKGGVQHYGNASAPTLPVAVAAVTSTITGLHDFHPTPHHQEVTVAPTAGSSASTLATHPLYTSSTSGNHFIAPGDFYTIYDETPLLAASVNGAGITVAIAGQTDISLADIAAFRSVSGLSANAPTVTLYGRDPGVPSQDDLIEAELDVEWSGATAPSATINFINSTDVIDGSLTYAVNNNVAPIISTSYGLCEAGVGASTLTYYNSLFKQANAQGQTLVAAAGDAGATDCDSGVTSATGGLAVDFPAALPTVTAVGGTMYNENGGTYFGSSNNANGGSALSYVPEAVWNEDALGYGLSSGGGGASAYFTKPVWQVGTGVPADASRDVPDVSLNAAASHDPYLICTSGYCTNGYRNSTGYLDAVGGTSVGAPSFSGLLALVVQKTGGRLGNANQKLYALFNSTYAASVFHDITVGTNASPCTAGSTNCPNGGYIGYAAGVGYDQASGIGSVDAFNMATDWNLVAALSGGPTSTSSTTLALSSTSVTSGATVTLTATVSGTGSVAPTGTVQFLVDNVAVGSAVTLSGSTATYSLATAGLSSGAHTITAAYNGDMNYVGSKATATLDITSATNADFTLTPAVTTVTTASGSTAQGVTFTVAALNGFTGSVNFTASTTSTSLNAQYLFSVNPVVVTSTTASGQTVFTLIAYVADTKNSGLIPSVKKAVALRLGTGVALGSLLLLMLPRRRRTFGVLAAAVLAIGTLGVSGCGTGGNVANGSSQINTTPGTYPITVTASGVVNGVTVTHNASVTFVVQ